MALPSFAVTGNLQEILGDVASSELVESALSRARITFKPNVPEDLFVTYAGSMYRILPVSAVVDTDGDIVLPDAGPVRLVAQDEDLNIDNLQWQFRVELPSQVIPPLSSGRMRSWWFWAENDGVTVDLTDVAPVVAVDVQNVITGSIDGGSP
jgi:protein involved in polysaccharide export with SLBB domain